LKKGTASIGYERPEAVPIQNGLSEERPERLFSVSVCVRSVCVNPRSCFSAPPDAIRVPVTRIECF
jgi:hypothetical protein